MILMITKFYDLYINDSETLVIQLNQRWYPYPPK